MREVKAGTPMSILDHRVFYDGVAIDAFEASYEVKNPSGVVATDEDGALVTARDPLIAGTGHYHAGNTVLPKTAPSGTWKIIWSIKKLSSSSTITREEEFLFEGKEVEDSTRESVSRRDIADSTDVWTLRVHIADVNPDDTKWAFFNSELKDFLERAVFKHTAGARTLATATGDDKAMSMLLAHAAVMYNLATDTRKFFKWRDSSEEADKSMIPKNCLAVAERLMAEYNSHVKNRLEEKKVSGTAGSPAGDLWHMRGARRRRR